MRRSHYYLIFGMVTVSACRQSSPRLLNEKAELPQSFRSDYPGLKFSASFINHKYETQSVLYKNAHVLALVKWKQQPDENWFGGKIPGELQCIEVVNTDKNASGSTYKKYVGKNGIMSNDTTNRQTRIKYILNCSASIMP